ncbi:unnamed protein product [Polarella glacialis]|uniref:ABC transporter domain-containing protein n=1 Tax=Polarella glacialis TaxID=89957 RepID=A0A813E8K0_POLGL|nr:unnamed protein product [Polarella glacialis]
MKQTTVVSSCCCRKPILNIQDGTNNCCYCCCSLSFPCCFHLVYCCWLTEPLSSLLVFLFTVGWFTAVISIVYCCFVYCLLFTVYCCFVYWLTAVISILKVAKAGTCYGLVGPNGCGKSTLLGLIEERRLPVHASWDVFLVGQHLPPTSCLSSVDEVLNSDVRRTKLLRKQASLEEELLGLAEGAAELFAKVNSGLLEVERSMAKWEGAERDVEDILVALGFQAQEEVIRSHASEPTIATPMDQLSGGWRMKVEMAKALWLQPRLLLLDEPTNHLDFQALRWLQGKLEEYPHTTIVVSHDVSFLHGVCREILWIKDCKLESMPRDMVSQEDLVRMQRRRPLTFKFHVPENDDPQSHGISLHGVEFSYPGVGDSLDKDQQRLFQVNGHVRFSGQSRSVLLGRNGSGKSTFLDLCSGKLSPTKGRVDRTPEIKIGHYSQLTDELDRNPTDTAASFLARQCPEALTAHAGCTRAERLQSALAARSQESEPQGNSSGLMARPRSEIRALKEKRLMELARSFLSQFGFEGDVAVTVPVDRLSGGQKACLKFAMLSLRPAHLLLLDEPTNHLDAEACEALATGLAEFKGGIVVVTHDELLIYRLIHCNWSTSELLVCQDGRLRRERDFGAHCLNALKEQARRAEEAEAAGGRKWKSQVPQPALPDPKSPATTRFSQTTGPAAIPPWLLRAPRAKKMSQAQEEGKQDQPGADASKAPVTAQMHKDMLSPTQEEDPARKSARHSRFRKDLINLNKAVTKWLRQEERGDASWDQILARIKRSAVAQQLRAVNGELFQEDVFVQDLLRRAASPTKQQQQQ